MELYRISGVGLALTESLNEMVATGEMPVEEAMRVLEIFDNTFEEELRKNVLVKRNLLVNEAQGDLVTYNNLKGTWKMDIENFRIQLGDCVKKYDRVRILFKK